MGMQLSAFSVTLISNNIVYPCSKGKSEEIGLIFTFLSIRFYCKASHTTRHKIVCYFIWSTTCRCA